MRPLHLIALAATLTVGCKPTDTGTDTDTGDTAAVPFQLLSLSASRDAFDEGDSTAITLTAEIVGVPDSFTWTQLSGPGLGLSGNGPDSAEVSPGNWHGATDQDVVFEYAAVADGVTYSETVAITALAVDMAPALGEGRQIGGATTAATRFTDGAGDDWLLVNIANRLQLWPVTNGASLAAEVVVPGAIHDIDVVEYDGSTFAILAADDAGIAVVDLTTPGTATVVSTTALDFYQAGLTWTEGGGEVLFDNEISGITSVITATETDGTDLWIANQNFGIQKTALANLLASTGPALETNGTLLVDSEAFALQYAGENPWGGPLDLELHNGRLFAAQGFLGMVIYDPATLERIAGYHLYTDASVVEDWFIDEDVAAEVQTGNLDPVTGMPNYDQVAFELTEVSRDGVVAPTPWADFDRYGKYYYNARTVEIVDGGNAIAYIAYGLGGLVAVDITGYDTATPGSGLAPSYLGYVPAVPAHGPDLPTGSQSHSLLPHHGAGMLKESGVVAVHVDASRNLVWFADHFAGLAVLQGAANPAAWGSAGAPYDHNDPNIGDGTLGDHWPDYEFVTSWDMSPYDPTDNESLPSFLYQAPFRIVTGEVFGHGNAFLLEDAGDPDNGGGIDLIATSGAGGLSFLDIDLSTDSFAITDHYAGTDEVGAHADGTPGEYVAIGHTAGVDISDDYLYIADGPHGLSAWRITDGNGDNTADIHLVANTLQDEYPVELATSTVYPTPHAYDVWFDSAKEEAWVSCQSLGLRRVQVGDVESGVGVVGTPLLLEPQPTDFFEHNTEVDGNYPGIKGQDHAYDVAMRGNIAFVADGSSGLVAYDVSLDPTSFANGYAVGKIGNERDQPGLGRATGVALWEHSNGTVYAFVAAGPRGIGVVDVTDPANMQYVKVFEPIKIEDGKVGHADGRGAYLDVIGDYVVVAYDSFGMVTYSIADLIAPVPQGVDPLVLWDNTDGVLQFDYRPEATSRMKLSEQVGFETSRGGALKFVWYESEGRPIVLAAYGVDGLVRIDYADMANPVPIDVANTVGEASDVAMRNGWIYVADGAGGLAIFN